MSTLYILQHYNNIYSYFLTLNRIDVFLGKINIFSNDDNSVINVHSALNHEQYDEKVHIHLYSKIEDSTNGGIVNYYFIVIPNDCTYITRIA